MIEQLLANPYAGDRTEHPDMHLIYVDEICGLFKIASLPGDEAKKKVFPLSLKGKALAWYRLDTPILHHVYLLLFIMFLCIIMIFGVFLMPFLS